MKKFALVALLVVLSVAAISFWSPISSVFAGMDSVFSEKEPDIPAMLRNAKDSISKEEFLQKRDESYAMR